MNIKQITTFSFLLLILSCKENETSDIKPIPDNGLAQDTSVLRYTEAGKPMLFEFTSTGCPGCGSWGKPTFHSIINQNKNEIIPIAVHIKYGDPMITPISEAITSNTYGSRYTPQIWVNDTNGVILAGGSINGQESVNNLNRLAKNASFNPKIYMDGRVTKKGNSSIYIKTGIKQSSELKGSDYFLSCYLMNDSLSHNQASSPSNPTIHNYVIRQSASGDAWGEQVTFDNANFEFQFEFKNVDHTKVTNFVSILWKKEKGRYVPICAYKFQ